VRANSQQNNDQRRRTKDEGRKKEYTTGSSQNVSLVTRISLLEYTQGDVTMATLAALKFSTPDGAAQALGTLKMLQQQQLINIEDAAVVDWKYGKKGPSTHQQTSMAGAGALGGAFWGMLFGLIFFVPILGLVVGAATGALGGALTDYGIDDNFIKRVRSEVTEGTSALFVMSDSAVVDRVVDAIKPLNPEVIASNLSPEQEAQLRELFAQPVA
jgi:uncharacterized membrane protein